MESVHVNQRLRPKRFAFIIPPGDLSAVSRAASINTALWGGKFNPIVPIRENEELSGILKEFDPDELLVFDGVELPQEIEQQFEQRIQKEESVVKEDDRSKKKDLWIGFNILPLLNEIYRTEIRINDDPSRARLIVAKGDEEWQSFVSVLFGDFSLLPEMDRDYEDAFKNALRAELIELEPTDLLESVTDIVSPIQFTAQELTRFGGRASISTHVVFIGDRRKPEDLVAFWNLRATGRRVWFVPTDSYELHEPMVRVILKSGRYAINPQLENQANIQKSPSISEESALEIQEWINNLGEGTVAIQMWTPRYGHSIDMYVGDIHVAELEAGRRQDITQFEGGKHTWVNAISPEILGEERSFKKFSWAIEVSFIGGDYDNATTLSLPRSPGVESLMQRTTGQRDARIGERGIVILEDSASSSLHFSALPTEEVFHAIFEDAGFDASASDPGIYADQIINKMGNLHSNCRIFKIRGVREIIDRLSSGESLDQATMRQIVVSEEDDGHGKNWRDDLYSHLIIRKGQRGKLSFSEIFDELLDNQIIRPGLKLRCQGCRHEEWYHISEFSEEFTCRLCFSRERVRFSDPKTKQWKFKSDGFFRIPASARGSLSVITSLWRFSQFGMMSNGKYITSTNLSKKKGSKKNEIDYAYLHIDTMGGTSFQLVLGEAKGFRDLENSDVKKMCEIADEFKETPFLAFSTLKEKFSSAERALLTEATAKGYRLIVFTREELDPYDLFDRFGGLPHKYAVTLDQLSVNTVHLNLTL